MPTFKARSASLFVDKEGQRWIVRDPEGNFWTLPTVEDAWAHREPFKVTEAYELEAVPGHYLFSVNLPF